MVNPVPAGSEQPDPIVSARNEREFAVGIRQIHREWLDIKREFEMIWRTNIHFVRGDQFLRFDRMSGRLFHSRNSRQRRRHIPNNKMRVARNQYIARLIQSRPTFQVVATNTDRRDQQSAKMADRFLNEYIWHEYGMLRTLARVYGWMFDCGTGFIEHIYKFMGPQDQEGRHLIVPVSPFEMFFPADIDPNDPREGLRVYHMRVSDVSAKFGVEVRGETDSSSSNVHLHLRRELGQKPRDRTGDLVMIREYYRVPDEIFPDGIHALYAQEINPVSLLQDETGAPVPFEPIPTAHRGLPWAIFQDPNAGDSMWWAGRSRDAVPLQQSLNRTLDQIEMSQEKTAFPKWWVAEGSSVGQEYLTDIPGEIIPYNAATGHPPRSTAGPPIPGYVIQMLQYKDQAIGDIFAQHGVSQGRLPKGVSAGVTLRLIQEQDATSDLGVQLDSAESFKRMGRMILQEEQEFGPPVRIMTIAGQSGEQQFQQWRATDLDRGWQVHVNVQSQLPRSFSGRFELLNSFYSLGLLGAPGSPQAVRLFRQKMGSGLPDELFRDDELERNVANFEQDNIQQGVEMVTYPFFNHEIHLEEHRRWFMENYPQWARMGDVGQQLIFLAFQHMLQHIQFIQQVVAAQQPAQPARPQARPQQRRAETAAS